MGRGNRLILCCVLVVSWAVAAGQNRLDFDVLSIDDGFSSSRANVIIQDRAGFMWVGTWNGLNRYDGYECEVYQPFVRDTNSLSSREVTSLFENKEGFIWVGTTFGLNRLNPMTNEIRVYPFNTRITSVYEDRKGSLWVGTEGDGVYKVDQLSGAKEQFLGNEMINAILEDSRNEFWLATNNGLLNFDRETHSYKRYFRREEGIDGQSADHQAVNCIVESDDGDLWAGLFSVGLVRIISNSDKDNLKFEFYSGKSNPGSNSPQRITELSFDPFGNLWIGTWGNGLYLLKKDEQAKLPDQVVFQKYVADVNDPFSIEGNNHISALFVDRKGTLWAGSSVINVANIANLGIERVNIRYIDQGQIVNHWIRSIATDPDGNVWLGSSDGLMVFNQANKEIVPASTLYEILIKMVGNPVAPPSLVGVIPSFGGLTWIASEEYGLFVWPEGKPEEISNKKIKRFYPHSDPALPPSPISVMAPSKHYPNVLWLGTNNNGIVRCDFSGNQFRFTNYPIGKQLDNLSNQNVRTIVEDHDGLVWIGTQHGLNCFDPKTEKFRQYLYSAKDANSINDNVINVIFEDSQGDLWIGSNAGLNRKKIVETPDGEKKVIFESFPDQGWIDNQIVMNILEDQHQYLWIGIYNGIIKFDKRQGKVTFEFFNKTYQRIKILNNIALKEESGHFIMGGGNGFLRFHPDSIQKKSSPPLVQITDLLLFNKSVPVAQSVGGKVLLKKSVTYTDTLTFSYKQGVITFVFSAMDFISPDKTKYAYQLDGYDKDWNYVGPRNMATYTAIPPGSYTFRVKACNSMGEWSDQSRNIFIKIRPPFWKSTFAYLVYAGVVIGLLYFFKRYSIIQIKEKGRLMLEKVQYEKEHELNELKVHFFTNITHEFRTPLTLILGPLQEMLEQKGKFGAYAHNLELIQRNANRLLRLINQLMEFRKVEKGKTELLLQEVDVVLMLVEIYDSFHSLADSKNIDFSLQYSEPSIHAWLDLDKFDKVLFNLLSNAFKFTDEGGKVSIKAGYANTSISGNSFFIEIEDSGVGIPPEKKDLVFERFYQINQKSVQSTGGIGLYLSKAFVELHNGMIELESEVGKGSSFRILMPTNLNGQVANKFLAENSLPGKNHQVVEWITSPELQEEERREKQDEELVEPGAGNQEQNRSFRPVVLLAEDDLDMNEFIMNSLSPHFKVRNTFNGKEALELARRINPDMILSDIMMPEMDGLELGRALQTDINTSHIPILYLTAKTTRENEIEGLQAGAVDYICKPFSMSALKLKITNILAQKAAQREQFHKNNILEPETIILSSLDEQFLKDAVAAVNAHLDDPVFDVEKLSNAIGLSSNQTYRKIKALTGQTAKEFIRNQRLKTAANLLIQKKRSVSEIIYMVGFSSPSYFTRCFKDYFGVTPSEYIENN